MGQRYKRYYFPRVNGGRERNRKDAESVCFAPLFPRATFHNAAYVRLRAKMRRNNLVNLEYTSLFRV